MPSLHGILETALYVGDLALAANFYQRVFGFERLLDTERLVALNVADKSVLLLFLTGATEEPATMPGGVIPPHGAGGKSHFAFSISAEDFESWREELAFKNVGIESTVDWPGGARSIFFRDPDDNLVELITPGFWSIY
jgi:catechol 2,3-dioxygenase-like lactoylglutathione lyase family enzyme